MTGFTKFKILGIVLSAVSVFMSVLLFIRRNPLALVWGFLAGFNVRQVLLLFAKEE